MAASGLQAMPQRPGAQRGSAWWAFYDVSRRLGIEVQDADFAAARAKYLNMTSETCPTIEDFVAKLNVLVERRATEEENEQQFNKIKRQSKTYLKYEDSRERQEISSKMTFDEYFAQNPTTDPKDLKIINRSGRPFPTP